MKYNLGDICNIFTGKKDVNQTVFKGPYCFFSCSPKTFYSNEYLYDGEAIIVAGNGSFTGRTSFYNGKFDLYQRTYACTKKERVENISLKFVYYAMKWGFEPHFMGGTRGSSIPYIVRGDLESFEVPGYDFPTQRRIAAVLSSFDDKIELNNKINANLQQQAQALFKSWLSSNDFEYVPLASVTNINPDSYNLSDAWQFYKYLDTSSITNNVISEMQIYENAHELPSRAKRKVIKNDIVYSTVRPNQHHFGLILCDTKNMLVSTGFSVIRCKDSDLCNEFIYLFLTQKEVIEEFQQLAEQSTSTFPAIKPADIAAKQIPYSADVVHTLKPMLEPLFSCIQKNSEENRRIAELRDTLLPKLMSGELDVSDIELSEVSDA